MREVIPTRPLCLQKGLQTTSLREAADIASEGVENEDEDLSGETGNHVGGGHFSLDLAGEDRRMQNGSFPYNQ